MVKDGPILFRRGKRSPGRHPEADPLVQANRPDVRTGAPVYRFAHLHPCSLSDAPVLPQSKRQRTVRLGRSLGSSAVDGDARH
jgi:hypothetical protein